MTETMFLPAPFWRRLVARSIDLVVCMGLTFVAVIPALAIVLPLSLVIGEDAAINIGCLLCFVLAYVLVEYFLLRRRGGQTLGKGLLGLRVLDVGDVKATGHISARAALLRMAVLIGPIILSTAAFYATYRDSASNTAQGNVVSDTLIGVWFAVLAVSALTAVLDRRQRRGLADFAAGTRVVRAQTRGIKVGQDLMMLVPGKVSLEKHPAPTLAIALDKSQVR